MSERTPAEEYQEHIKALEAIAELRSDLAVRDISIGNLRTMLRDNDAEIQRLRGRGGTVDGEIADGRLAAGGTGKGAAIMIDWQLLYSILRSLLLVGLGVFVGMLLMALLVVSARDADDVAKDMRRWRE